MALKREKGGRNILVILAVMLTAALSARPGRALPVSLDALPASIAALYSEGSYSQAADALQAAIVQHPKDASLYYWVGRAYFEIRDFNRSISSWERAVALDLGRSEYHDWLGRAYGRKADESSHSNMAAALSLARRTHHEFEVCRPARCQKCQRSARPDCLYGQRSRQPRRRRRPRSRADSRVVCRGSGGRRAGPRGSLCSEEEVRAGRRRVSEDPQVGTWDHRRLSRSCRFLSRSGRSRAYEASRRAPQPKSRLPIAG